MATLYELKKQISSGKIPEIENVLPAGVDVRSVIKQAIDGSSSDELDKIGGLYGLKRTLTYWLPEPNTIFSDRIADFLAKEIMDYRTRHYGGMFYSGDSEIPIPDWDSRAACNHKWKKYVGIMDSFEYCEICDEKRR